MKIAAKKLFAVATAAATIAVSVVPFAASAAVHAVGDNVLSSDGTIWMITPQNTRRAYTSGGAFLSYGFNSFATVKTASPEDLSLPVDPAGFIPPQDGSIICSDRGADKGTCYLITGGQKAGFTSSAVFTGRGFKFSTGKMGDVSFLSSVSNIDDTTSANRPGVLVNKNGTVFLVGQNGLLGIPDLTTFNGWGFSFAKVVPANSADMAMSITGVMAARTAGQLSPTALSNPGNPNPGTPGGSLSVSLSSGTPGASDVASGAAFIPFTALNFSAGSSAVTVTGLTLTRSGLGADSNLNNMYLFNGANMLAQSSSIQNGKVMFSSNAGLFTVPANSTLTVWVKGDIASGAASGLTYAFSVNSASDVVSNATSVSGSFPIMGNSVRTVTVSSPSLATLTLANVAVGSSVNAGTTGVLAAQYSLTAANSAVSVRGVTLTAVGSVNAANDLKNIKLMALGTQYGVTATGVGSNNTVFFDLSANPLVVPSGQAVQLQVFADVMGGASRNFYFSIQRNYDVQAYDTTYGVGILSAGTFPISGTTVTVNSGSLTISRSSDSRTNAVASSQTSVKLATFDFRANGEDVKIFSLPISIALSGGTVTMTNVKLVDDTGFGIGSAVTSTLTYGPANTPYTNTFGSSANLNYVVPANTTRKVSIVADITSVVSGSPVITASLTAGASGNAQGVTSVASITTSAASGNALTVSSTTLSAATNNSVASPIKVVPGAEQAKVASFTLTAGGADAVNVTTITLAAAAASVAGNFQNLVVKVGSTQIGNTQNVLTNSASYSFSPSSPLNIPAGQSIVVDVYASLISSASATLMVNNYVVQLTGVTAQLATSGAATAAISTKNGQGVTTSSGGTVTISKDSSTPTSRQVTMGATGVVLGVIKVKENTGNESARITDITVTATAVAGTTLNGSSSGSVSTLKNITISDGAGNTCGQSNLTGTDATGTTTYTVACNNVNFTIPAGPNSYLLLTVKADVNNFDNGAASNAQFTVGIAAAADVTIRGNSSNSTISPTVTTNATSNTTTVLRTSLVVSSVSSISSPVSVTVNSTGVPSSGETVAIFNVTAGAGGDAILNSVTLQQGGTAPTAAAVTYYVYDASASLSNPVGTATLTGSTAGAITLNLNSASADSGVRIPCSASATNCMRSLVIKADTANFNTGSSGTIKSYTLGMTTWTWNDQTTGGLGVSGDQTTVNSAANRSY